MLILLLAILSYLTLLPGLHIGISRQILQSSTVFSNQLTLPQLSQSTFDGLCATLIDSDRSIQNLRQIPIQDLLEASLPFVHNFRPSLDGITIKFDPRQEILTATHWDPCLKAIIMGNCANEVGGQI